MPKSLSSWGRSVRQHFPEYPAIHSPSAPGKYNSQGSVRAATGGALRRCLARKGDGGVVEVSAPLPVQTGGLAALERGFPAEMPGENEKQPGQAPKQVPPGRKQWARECSEQLSSARGDGRRVECFAVSGELSRRLGSVRGADRHGCAGGNSTGADQPRYNLRITGGVVVCQCGLSIPSHACDTLTVIL
ncbi:RPA-interacting protein isoform X2 [Nomascus leucogenys]|uniref:RPA-interacting protein isoform X2 n=1 Tax=Nomascus leucogenys TaxID=61853 RepID=UPI00122D9DE1|nr:RPA-interacting protein isoform X2 [Nomascus leucogenys]